MPEDAPALSPRLEAIAAPLSGDSPVGVDVRYEDAFQELKGEVDAAQSASGDADFGRVVELATKILSEQSKDLTTATYLGLGLLRTEGLGGMGEGLDAVRLLSEVFWDDLFPPSKRMAARKNAIQLLLDRSIEWLEAYKPSAADTDQLNRIRSSTEGLETLVGEKMEAEAPIFSRLLQVIDTKQKAAEKPIAEKAAPGGGDAEGEGGVVTLQTPADATNSVLAAVSFLRENDRKNPTPYRLARALRWGGLRALPPNEDGKTQLPVFVEQRQTFLLGLLEKAEHEKVLAEAESSFIDTPFWLDLQRYLHTSAEALGEAFQPVGTAILEEVAVFVHRFPSLPTLTFNSGTPIADGATQLWLDTRVRPLLGGGISDEDIPSPDGEGDLLGATYEEARAMLTSGDLEGALAKMAEGEAPGEAGRDRFRRQLYIASLCRLGGRSGVARAVLEGLETEIDRAGVAAWEPSLALNAWTALHACYAAIRRDASKDEQHTLEQAAERVVEKVARLAPRQALTLLDKN